METAKRDIIVMGASYGGHETINRIISALPERFEASLFVVNHGGYAVEGSLWDLRKAGNLECRIVGDDEPIRKGTAYFAPQDRHLVLRRERVGTVRGPVENRARPAIDPLFRSAAVAFGPRVVGVVLTGYLDDGSSGLRAVRQCGGIGIVQDPEDAIVPEMPLNAVRFAEPEFVLTASEIAGKLVELAKDDVPAEFTPPETLRLEQDAMERMRSDFDEMDDAGERTFLTCPDCGGVLWETDSKPFQRFRCHLGHSYSLETLLAGQDARIDEMLLAALRLFEERTMFLRKLTNQTNGDFSKTRYDQYIKDSETYISTVRDILKHRSFFLEDRREA